MELKEFLLHEFINFAMNTTFEENGLNAEKGKCLNLLQLRKTLILLFLVNFMIYYQANIKKFFLVLQLINLNPIQKNIKKQIIELENYEYTY